jgi:hypothetical protein
LYAEAPSPDFADRLQQIIERAIRDALITESAPVPAFCDDISAS